jgi:nicotinamide-nucleotide amidase
MDKLIKQVHGLLIAKRQTLAIAESCTGGLLASLFTSLPGSSKYLTLGIIAYSNQAKENILRIPHRVISKHGAVSADTARAMAANIRKIAKTNYGISITGIAGPTGASVNKPVGTVFIALDSPDKKICEKFNFTGSRLEIRKKSALAALRMLKAALEIC